MADKNNTSEPDKTGHSWDGIEEYNNPLPRWWLWTFYVTIVWALIYTILYPAWPGINSATPGILGYSTRANVAEEIEAVSEANAGLDARLVETELGEVMADADLARYVTAGGAAVFRTYCAQCHGAGAAGVVGGYPNLLDDDWLWGGTKEEVYQTIAHGIRWETDDDTRYSEMPAFGEVLSSAEVKSVVEFVLQIGGEDHDADRAALGAPIFADNCASCHGDAGIGDPSLGAPNLTDAIWLYGSDREALSATVRYARFGIMPAWTGRLTESQLRQVTLYVHQLGGGE